MSSRDPCVAATAERYVGTLTLPARKESVRPAVSFVVETARALRVAAGATPLFEVAVNEAISNAVRHGQAGIEDAVIVCEVEAGAGQLAIRILDSGPGFAMTERQLPDITPERLESLPESGYGLPIIQSVFPSVRAIRVKGRFGLELSVPL